MTTAVRVREWVQGQQGRLLALLEHLVGIQSHTANPAGVAAAADVIIAELEPLGFRFESHRPPALPSDDVWLQDVFSPGIPYEHLGSTYVGTAVGSRPGRLLLLGDLDTAFPEESAETASFRIEGNRAFGPGIADMKGGLVVLVAALQGLQQTGVDLPEVTLVLSGDEQAGSLGSGRIIGEVGHGADWSLCVECARRGGKLMAGRGHIGIGRLDVSGVEAHTGSERDFGIDALEALAHLVIEMKALSRPEDGTLVTVTIAEAGRRRSVVPARARATVDIRTASPRNWVDVIERLHAVAARVEEQTGASVGVQTYDHRRGVLWNDRTDALLSLAASIGSELEIDVDAFVSSAAGSSAFADPASSILDGLGPIGGGLMTTHEHIEIDSIAPRAALLAGLIDALPGPVQRGLSERP